MQTAQQLYRWLFDMHTPRRIALSVLDSYLPTIRSMYSPIRQGSMDKTHTSAITKQELGYTSRPGCAPAFRTSVAFRGC